MSQEVVLLEKRGSAAWLTLNRPEKLNAMSVELVRTLKRRLLEVEADDSVKVVVLTGAGRSFSAGYDIEEEVREGVETTQEWRAVLAQDIDMAMTLWSLSRPTIAAVRGWCLAGACELAMACDMVVATEDARFGEPEIRYGSGPVALVMPFVLGEKKTNELLFTGDTMDATEAHRAGLVNRVVKSEDLESAVDELVRKVALTPLAVLKLTKIALVRAYEAMGIRGAVASNIDIAAILHSSDTPELREFHRIVAADGLRAALRWRDERYAEQLGSHQTESR
ncbi:MAG TPA: enoyl-CoA hydratase/isomerase family protein, partial [Candidatus Dormibacteraeota bacterium]|nr:enoyl-CoA hydratase/isomerase family protein [Candidatus Dormibacteraeota bacterium]